jgi:hypothetical protein
MYPYMPWGDVFDAASCRAPGAQERFGSSLVIGCGDWSGLLYLSESVNFFIREMLLKLSAAPEASRNVKMGKPLSWRRPLRLLKLDSLHRFCSGSGLPAAFYAIRDCD